MTRILIYGLYHQSPSQEFLCVRFKRLFRNCTKIVLNRHKIPKWTNSPKAVQLPDFKSKTGKPAFNQGVAIFSSLPLLTTMSGVRIPPWEPTKSRGYAMAHNPFFSAPLTGYLLKITWPAKAN